MNTFSLAMHSSRLTEDHCLPIADCGQWQLKISIQNDQWRMPEWARSLILRHIFRDNIEIYFQTFTCTSSALPFSTEDRQTILIICSMLTTARNKSSDE